MFGHVDLVFGPTCLLSPPVLPVLLPAGHARRDSVRPDLFVGEGAAAHAGRGRVPGALPPHLRAEVVLPGQPAVQHHQVSNAPDAARRRRVTSPSSVCLLRVMKCKIIIKININKI